MKKYFGVLLSLGLLSVSLLIPLHAEMQQTIETSQNNVATKNNATNESKIKEFLQQQTSHLSEKFPYRLNLFTQGQVDKNKAGVRIAETAKQLFANNAGLVFYYELYNHSMRVPHWHANAVEVGTVLSGKMKVTIWEGKGQRKVFTVEQNGTWMIPQAALHSLENIGDGQLTFFVSYNSPIAADRDFATAWASLPDTILSRTLGLSPDDVATIRKTTVNRLSSFDPSAMPEKIDKSSPLSSSFNTVKPLYQSDLGIIKRIDATTNPTMQAMALQQTILKPGVMRVSHWYTGADTLLFVYKGNAFFTMMDNNGKVYNALVKPGDLIFIPVGNFHTYLNIDNQNLEIYEAFNASKNLAEVTLLNGSQQFSVGTLTGATGLSKASAEKIMQQPQQNYMMKF